jgi:hypothetical protein
LSRRPTYFGLGANVFAWGERRQLRFEVDGWQLVRFGVPQRLHGYVLHQIMCERPSGNVDMLAVGNIPIEMFSTASHFPQVLWPDQVKAVVLDVEAVEALARPRPRPWWSPVWWVIWIWLWLTRRPRLELEGPAAPPPFVGAFYVVPVQSRVSM